MVKNKLEIGIFSAMYSQMNGLAHGVRFLSNAIAKLGHDVHIFAPCIQDGYKKPKTLHFHDVGGVQIGHKTGFILSVPIHKIFLCQQDYLDIAHIHTHATVGTMAINWAKYLGIPMIGSHHSPMQFYTAQYIPIFGKLLAKNDIIWRYERQILNKYDLVHVPTKTKKDLLINYRFKEPIIALNTGIPDFYFSNLKENGIREKYNLKDKKVLLYASRLSPEKHPIRVIKSFREIHKKVPNSHLMLVGSPGPSTDAVERIVKKKKYRDFISYEGRVPFEDLLKLYNAVDLTCLWSWVEAEGLVLAEAMAQGTPSVGANGCGIANIIRHGVTGYLANNLKEFNEYIIKLLQDDDLREEFGKNAKKIAQDYRIEKVAKTWVELYRFTIDELYPLRYHREERRYRVELVKEFIKQFPNIYF